VTDRATAVIDIGGGSTELVVGRGADPDFHVSTQVGVVRHSERHLNADPPTGAELAALREDAGAILRDALPADPPERVVAVAGTATMAASMDLELEPFDADRVEGHILTLDALRERLKALAAVPLQERVKTPGLHPDRAPTIVAGVAILIEILEATGAETVTVSDRDILYGRALEAG
jgi:exopolyphosphatase/guanosine-5'-triphosphate,3'-diphosphate pyrophosphatase